ncbi:hypothetical protein [Paenibacillus ihumii]|uniref:hypothetical protein n=1 Tax=Paenibacillus ihumii TaxID=687436 RepID=UPI0006D7D91B|nr:hypothetical protein [Paenibacillus ihumii]
MGKDRFDNWVESLQVKEPSTFENEIELVRTVDTSRPWVGSSNQRYHFLTERYAHLQEQLTEIPNRPEVRLAPDGRVMVNGLAEVKDLEDLFGRLL